jgi:hypothetical protein
VLSAGAGEAVKVLVQSSPLAGSQYYAVDELWSQIRPGDRLTWFAKPTIDMTGKAVRVEWNGRQLGYVPRAENRAVARALDAGEKTRGARFAAAPGSRPLAPRRVRGLPDPLMLESAAHEPSTSDPELSPWT